MPFVHRPVRAPVPCEKDQCNFRVIPAWIYFCNFLCQNSKKKNSVLCKKKKNFCNFFCLFIKNIFEQFYYMFYYYKYYYYNLLI